MPTIIDTFVVMLGLDTKGMKTGEKEAKEGVKDLEHHMSEAAEHIKEQGAVAGEFYTELAEKAATFFAFIAGGVELKEFVKSEVEAQVETLHLSEMIGMSSEEIQKWRGAVILSDGKAEEFDHSIKHLSGSLVDIAKSLPRSERAIRSINAAMGEGYVQKGQKKDLLTVLDDFAKKAQGMDIQVANRLGERIFGGNVEAMIRLMRKGAAGIAEAKEKAASAGLFSDEDMHASDELKERWNELGLAGRGLARSTIMGFIMPALKAMSDAMSKLAEWAAKHPDGMKAMFVGMAAGITAAATAVTVLTLSFSPLMFTMAGVSLAIGAIAAGAYMIYEDWDKWLPKINGLVNGLGDDIQDSVTILNDYKEAIKASLSGDDIAMDTAWQNLWEDMKQVALNALNQISWEILDLPYKMIRAGREMLIWSKKDQERWEQSKEMFGLGGKPKHKTSSSADGPSWLDELFPKVKNAQPWTLGWAWNGFDTNSTKTPGKQSSLKIDTLIIQSATDDPQSHADVFTKYLEDYNNGGLG